IPEPAVHCAHIDTHAFADPASRPARLVERDDFVDLVGGEADHPHGYLVAVQSSAHGLPVDVELGGKLVDGGACDVASYQLVNLGMAQLPDHLGSCKVALGPPGRDTDWPGQRHLKKVFCLVCLV